MATDNSFEMADLCVFAEKSVKQAKAAFDSFAAATQQAVDRAQSQAMSAQSGVKEMGELAMRYTERNITASFEFAQQLMRAKDATEMAKLHSEYIKSQLEALAHQAQQLRQHLGKVGTSAKS